MKKINPDHIDHFFSNMKEDSIDADSFQLEDMEIRLESIRFYKFGWKHFNIYYILLILLHCGITAGILVYYLTHFSNEIGKPNYYVKKYLHQETLQNRAQKDTAESKLESIVKTKKLTGSANKKMQLVRIIKSDSALDSEIKSIEKVATKTNSNPDSIILPNTSKPKRIVYVKKRDTIIQFDTTRTIRKK